MEEKKKYVYNPKAIKKQLEISKKQSKNLYEYDEDRMTSCKHLNAEGGHPDLGKSKNSDLWYCKVCQKNNISLSPKILDEAKLDESITHIDQVLDILKMHLVIKTDEDRKVFKRVVKTQFFVRVMLKPLVQAIKGGKKNNKKNKGNGNGGGATWGKSRTV